jgi:glyoxylase-like metal-dependent hydrolase (beta-lactamase superfamily II)
MLVPIALPICNVFLLRGTRPILIDTGRPGDFAAIVRALDQHRVAPADLELILHTHGHWDHAGSTAQFRTVTEAPLAIHGADAPMMRRGDNGVLRPTTITARVLRPLLDRRYPGTEPTLLLDRERDLHEFGVAARILLTPGHTAGSISVLTDAGDALIGDLLMGGYFGGWLLPHRPGLHYFADDVSVVRASIRKVLDQRPARLYPAHGGPLDPAVVERWLKKS